VRVELLEPVASSLAPEVSWLLLLRMLVEASSSLAHAEARGQMVRAERVGLDLLPFIVAVICRLLGILPLLPQLFAQSAQVLAT